jgi:hypothetical protein
MKAMQRMWLAPAAMFLFAACGGGESGEQQAAANPCAANPCAANPCAATQELPIDRITQGDRDVNDHGMSEADLVARGKELWADASLSGAGATSCGTCHSGEGYGMMNAGFAAPYPHPVAMAKDRAGFEQVTAAEMVQLCMVIPMGAEPLDWDSEELAALSAYVLELQKGFDPASAGGMNPCATNPCAANPCAANPCAANPCAPNPCAANPCSANPCGGK